MLANRINVKGLKTIHDCDKAIDQIENDYRNYYSSLSDWNSGKSCYMKEHAIDKIKAINNRIKYLEN